MPGASILAKCGMTAFGQIMTTNKLRIRAKSLDLDLAGEPEYILRAYDAIQPVLMERFEESVDAVLETPGDAARAKTMRMHAPVDPSTAATQPDEGVEHLNVVVCNEVYNKIYLMERSAVQASIFGRAIDTEQVARVFVNRSQSALFEEHFHFGKVLWRELTTAGRRAVKKP